MGEKVVLDVNVCAPPMVEAVIHIRTIIGTLDINLSRLILQAGR